MYFLPILDGGCIDFDRDCGCCDFDRDDEFNYENWPLRIVDIMDILLDSNKVCLLNLIYDFII